MCSLNSCIHIIDILASLQIIFSLSLSYVRPGTMVHLTYNPFGQTKREERMIRTLQLLFLDKTLTLWEVSSQLFKEDHATSVWMLPGLACLCLTQMRYVSCKWKQIELHYCHYIKSPPSRLPFFSENIFYVSCHNWRAFWASPTLKFCYANVWWSVIICRLVPVLC